MKKVLMLLCFMMAGSFFLTDSIPLSAEPEAENAIMQAEASDILEEPFLSPSELSKAKEEFNRRMKFFFIKQLYPIAALILIVFAGVSKKIFTVAKGISKSYYLQLPLFALLFLLAFTVFTFPYDFWQLRSTGDASAVQILKQVVMNGSRIWLLLSAVFTVISFPFLWLVRKSRFWWVWATAVGSVLVFVMMTMQLYSNNSIKDNVSLMPDSTLKERLDGILEKAGRKGLPIYVRETKEEKRTGFPNGFGGGIPPKVILWDFEGADYREVEFIFAHELSHYLYKHFWSMIPIGMVFLVVGLPLIGWLTGLVGRRCRKLTGFSEIGEIPALSTWFLLFTVYFFISIPFQNMCGRVMEVQADHNGSRLSGQPLGGAQIYARYIRNYKIYPDPPFYLHIWEDPHPAYGPRVRYLKKLDEKYGGIYNE